MYRKIILATIITGILGIVCSCSNNDSPEIAGVNDYTGKFRLSYNTLSDACTNSSSNTNSISSENDLEIYKNDSFKLKVYSKNSNNDCVVSEILEGKIIIKGSFYEAPYGKLEYDNSEKNTEIYMRNSVNGKHNEITLYEKHPDNVVTSSYYGRTD